MITYRVQHLANVNDIEGFVGKHLQAGRYFDKRKGTIVALVTDHEQ
jgi:acyl-CoA thioesterase